MAATAAGSSRAFNYVDEAAKAMPVHGGGIQPSAPQPACCS